MRVLRAFTAVAGACILFVGCSGAEPEVVSDGNDVVGDPAGTEAGDAGDSGGDSGDPGDAPAVITVDGVTYPIPNFMGGSCDTAGEPEIGRDMAVYGYAEQGDRVELSFTHQASQSGEDAYYGRLNIGSGIEGPWGAESSELWPWLEGDRSSVSGTVTMADRDGNEVEVSFDVHLPLTDAPDNDRVLT